MSNLSIILWISVAAQCIAVLLALRLIPLTGRALAWIILSLAFLMMAARRAISLLYQQGTLQDSWLRGFTTEAVALTISLLLVTGLIMIRRIFVQQRVNDDKIRTLSLAVEQNPGVTIIINTSGKIEYVNSAYCSLTGHTLQQVIGTVPDILNSRHIEQHVLDTIWETLTAGEVWVGEVKNLYNDNYQRWENARISPVKNLDSKITHYVILLDDVTEQKEQREELEYMALHDGLTDLPNRTLFNDRLRQAIKIAKRNREPLAVMLMDLNNFKEINDSMGHQVGDEILREIATRLLEIIRDGDTVARMGGDEFLILLPAAKQAKQDHFIKRINSTLDTPFIVAGRSFEIRASIGVSLFPEDGEDPEILLKRADVAMYAAKRSVQTYKRYDRSLDAGSVSRMELSQSLRTAVEESQFVLNYQPVVNYTTGTIDTVEALIRWDHPDRGLLPPDSFIPLAEQTYQIGAITRWVIKNALLELASWNSDVNTGVSINISAHDLLDPELSPFIQSQLRTHNIKASRITIEITESALMMHTHQTLKNLLKLRAIGVKIYIDDFGTGYSSLQYLKRFPVTGLKIDKAFVMNMTNDDNDAIIVRSTTDLAHNMGLTVVAEGIEDQDVYDIVEILGCDYAQGYLIARPMPADQLVNWLNDWRAHEHRSGVRLQGVKK